MLKRIVSIAVASCLFLSLNTIKASATSVNVLDYEKESSLILNRELYQYIDKSVRNIYICKISI